MPDDATRERFWPPLLPLMLNTASTDEVERRRAWMVVDWALRDELPRLLDLFPELKDGAKALRALPEITSQETASPATPILVSLLALALALALDLDLALALARDLDLALALALALDLALALALALARALDRDLDLALARALDRALDLALALARSGSEASRQSLIRRLCAITAESLKGAS